MAVRAPMSYAFNQTRRTYLASQLRVAETHWSRFRGLMWTDVAAFGSGQGLWIVPSHGVHTFAMRFPIDVAYLDRNQVVVHMEQDLKPWRVAAVQMKAASVIELPSKTLQATGTSIGDSIEIGTGQ